MPGYLVDEKLVYDVDQGMSDKASRRIVLKNSKELILIVTRSGITALNIGRQKQNTPRFQYFPYQGFAMGRKT